METVTHRSSGLPEYGKAFPNLPNNPISGRRSAKMADFSMADQSRMRMRSWTNDLNSG